MESAFKKKVVCIECGDEVAPERAAYEPQLTKRYCAKCAPIRDLKQSWQPMHSGYSVSAIYIVPNKPNLNIVRSKAPAKDTADEPTKN